MRMIGGTGAAAGIATGGAAPADRSWARRSSARASSWRRRALVLSGVAFVAVLAALAVAQSPSLAPNAKPAPNANASGARLPAMPLGLAAAASPTIGAAERSFWPVRSAGSLRTRGGDIGSDFSASGARLRVGGGALALSLASVGRESRVERVPAAAPIAAANAVVYRHGSISELYRNGPYGLEQAFTLARRPGGAAAPLVLSMRASGSLIPAQAGPQIVFRSPSGAVSLRYGQLGAEDATGRQLPARIELRDGAVQLRVDDRGARYPLQIDPFFQQGNKLTGGDESGRGQFGLNVALSGDGNTALIGGPQDNVEAGAAWVFTRSGSTWTQQGPKLTGTGEVGKGHFGFAVALSSDGNTALIGAGADNGEIGAAWVFSRSGSTWTQQGAKLTGEGESGKGHFGFRVALSPEGNTALIGGPQDAGNVGAAWVFTRSEGTWTQQGSKLTGGEETGGGEFGEGVALSSDGSTAMVGGAADDGEIGATWAFTRSEGVWTQQGTKLTGAEELGKGRFGFRVALSEDGNTALIGGGGDDGEIGAAWVFTRSEGAWTQQGPKLTGAGEAGKGHFGFSVALSADGNTALVGGLADNAEVGAAWAFTRSGSSWGSLGSKLTASDESGKALFGYGVALSGDGATALIGGADDKSETGAAWIFADVAPHAPTAVTGLASGETPTSATLNATVNPDAEAVTDCHFEYGATTAYGTSVPCSSLPGAGGSPVAVSATVEGLVHTVYHFRIVATNALGTSEGADGRFITAEAPEYGRCVKVAPVKEGGKLVFHGGFTVPNCVTKSETKTGKYEWLPGVVKGGFRSALKEGVVTLETVKKVKTVCKGETGVGEIVDAQDVAGVVLKLSGCESAGQKCTTSGLAEGEIETKKLEGQLGWEVKSTKKAALDLFPVGKTGAFLEYACGAGPNLTVEGSILAPVVVDKLASGEALKYKATAGKQKPEHLEGGPIDVLKSTSNGETFEQLGETATLSEADEEAIEINAVV